MLVFKIVGLMIGIGVLGFAAYGWFRPKEHRSEDETDSTFSM